MHMCCLYNQKTRKVNALTQLHWRNVGLWLGAVLWAYGFGAPDSYIGLKCKESVWVIHGLFLGVDGERAAGAGLSGRSRAEAARAYLPIELLHIFRVPHNHIAVYHLGPEYSTVLLRTTLLTERDRQGRLIALIHSSFPLWGTENCLCHFPR